VPGWLLSRPERAAIIWLGTIVEVFRYPHRQPARRFA
jgi:hypothetical protein